MLTIFLWISVIAKSGSLVTFWLAWATTRSWSGGPTRSLTVVLPARRGNILF